MSRFQKNQTSSSSIESIFCCAISGSRLYSHRPRNNIQCCTVPCEFPSQIDVGSIIIDIWFTFYKWSISFCFPGWFGRLHVFAASWIVEFEVQVLLGSNLDVDCFIMLFGSINRLIIISNPVDRSPTAQIDIFCSILMHTVGGLLVAFPNIVTGDVLQPFVSCGCLSSTKCYLDMYFYSSQT